MGLVGELLQETYRIGDLLGSGGMGDVYAASHTRLNRRFAVKILHTRFAKNEEAYNRFRREAQITSELGHPHIVEVIDFNLMQDGSPYIVMEYLEGEDLEIRLQAAKRLDVATTVHIVRQLGSALAAAHKKQIVHRDLKPQNVFVSHVEEDNWYIKILDFGISKIRGSTSIVTQDKALLGTPNYMSPEQAEGKTDLVDHRTDQFALGTMVYEMISGTNPFDAESIPSIMYHVVHTEPKPLHELVPEISPAFGLAVGRAMSKKPQHRFAGIREFVRVLRGLPESLDTGPIAITTTAVSKSPGPPRGIATAQTVATNSGMTPTPASYESQHPATPDNVVQFPSGAPSTRDIGAPQAAPHVPSGAMAAAVAPGDSIMAASAESIMQAPPAKDGLIKYAGLGLLGIGAAVVSFLLVGGSGGDSKDKAEKPDNKPTADQTQPAGKTPAAVPDTTPKTTPDTKPAEIIVAFNVTPKADRILVDGKLITGDETTLPADGREHKVRFEKANYEPKEQTFEATEKQTISVELRKLKAKRTVRRNTRRANRAKRRAARKARKRTKTKTRTTTKKKKSKFLLDLD